MDLSSLGDDELLKLRFCDLPINLAEAEIYPLVEKLYVELNAQGLLLRPACYFADEWFSPEGETCIAIPFYLGHARLRRLEQAMMYEVEGGTSEWAMKILRHEAGHAVMHGFALHKRRAVASSFGKKKAYDPDAYVHRLYSKRFVRHLDDGYAQSHPDEDFAETFAVWLTPESNWKEAYRGWPAFKKLQTLDQIMASIKGQAPQHSRATFPYATQKSRKRLQSHYDAKRKLYAQDLPGFWDQDLRRLFGNQPLHPDAPKAHLFLLQRRESLLEAMVAWSRMPKYAVSNLLRSITLRAKALNLFVDKPIEQSSLQIAIYLTSLVLNYNYTGKYKGHGR